MSDQVVETPIATEGQEAPQLSEREVIEQEALARYKESQKTQEERESGMPKGYNEDGTPQEELIAGKFKSQEDLLKAYQELEKKLGQGKQQETTTENTPSEENPPNETEQPPKENGGGSEGEFNISKFEEEFAANGSLSEESYAELASKGFSKQQIDTYIQGQMAYADSVRNSIYDSVGGQEAYVEIINWASENMPQDVIQEYNDAVGAMDKDRVLRTLEYMTLKKGQSAPREARRLEGQTASTGIQPFANKNEWQRAMTDRLYGKDAKYTNMVDQRYLAARKKGIL